MWSLCASYLGAFSFQRNFLPLLRAIGLVDSCLKFAILGYTLCGGTDIKASCFAERHPGPGLLETFADAIIGSRSTYSEGRDR